MGQTHSSKSVTVQLDIDTVMHDVTSNAPYIVTRRSSSFSKFCLLAESLIRHRTKILLTYTPPRGTPSFASRYTGNSTSSDDDSEATSPDTASRPVSPGLVDVESGGGGGNLLPVHAPRGPNTVEMTDMFETAHLAQGLRNGVPEEEAASAAAAAEHAAHLGEDNQTLRRRGTMNMGPDVTVEVPNYQTPKRVNGVTPTIPSVGLSGKSQILAPTAKIDNHDANGYWIVRKVHMYAAYEAFMAGRKAEPGLLRAIYDGAVDVSVPASAHNPTAVVKERINEWRQGHADMLNAYNTTVDEFVVHACACLQKHAVAGDPQALKILQMATAIEEYKERSIPTPKDPETDGK